MPGYQRSCSGSPDRLRPRGSVRRGSRRYLSLWWGRNPACWQEHDEQRAPFGRELGRDLPAMELHDLAADVQAQPQAGSVVARVRLVETIEDPLTLVGRYADATVPHGQADQAGLRNRDFNFDLPATRAELDGVVHQVDYHLLDPKRVYTGQHWRRCMHDQLVAPSPGLDS